MMNSFKPEKMNGKKFVRDSANNGTLNDSWIETPTKHFTVSGSSTCGSTMNGFSQDFVVVAIGASRRR